MFQIFRSASAFRGRYHPNSLVHFVCGSFIRNIRLVNCSINTKQRTQLSHVFISYFIPNLQSTNNNKKLTETPYKLCFSRHRWNTRQLPLRLFSNSDLYTLSVPRAGHQINFECKNDARENNDVRRWHSCHTGLFARKRYSPEFRCFSWKQNTWPSLQCWLALDYPLCSRFTFLFWPFQHACMLVVFSFLYQQKMPLFSPVFKISQ